LRISPEWTRWTYRLLLGALAAALLFASVAPVREYAAGPGVVQLEGRRALTANTSGTASAILVEPGDRVEEGELLVRFYGASELADLQRIDRAFELELIKRLRDPVDPAAERMLSDLRAERGLALARLAERDVRAPAAGLVSDVRVRPGQHLSPGQILVTLQTRAPEPQLLAMLPGSQRPLLKPGMPLRFELEGYRYSYQRLEISAVGDEVVGPAEAQRYLGGELADAVPIDGPVVFVLARLPSASFEWNEQTYRLHDGMWGRVEVPVRSESVLLTMAPILRSVFTSRDG
jgi:membrane fusion protein (multidrug efflux system)